MDCPFCSHTASRHFDHHKMYWFCNHCWQEVPKYDQALFPEKLSQLLQTSLVKQITARTKSTHSTTVVASS